MSHPTSDHTEQDLGSRRQFLKTLGTGGIATALAGCSSDTENEPELEPTPEDPQSSEDEESTEGKDTEEETEPETEDPLEQTYQADQVEEVAKELEQDSVALNFQPADENAEYANSVLFTEYSTEKENALNVEIDLNQAQTQRHHYQRARELPVVEEFIQGVKNEDDEWVENLYNEYLDMAKGEDLLGLQRNIDWSTYKDESLDFEERIIESGFQDLWYLIEKVKMGHISSANNQYKAQAYQETEANAGFDTFVWDFTIPGHGLVNAIENPTRNKEEIGDQETYVVETDQGDNQQISTWENSQYQNTEIHPVQEGTKRGTKGFYTQTSMGKDEAEFIDTYKINMENAEEFINFYRNPESSPAYDHLDPMTATAYISEENIWDGELDGKVILGDNKIKLRT